MATLASSGVRLRATAFSMSDSPWFIGWHDPQEEWNGFECPFFTWSELERALDDLNKDVRVDWDHYSDGTVELIFVDDGLPSGGEVIHPEKLLLDNGQEILVYQMSGWCWNAIDHFERGYGVIPAGDEPFPIFARPAVTYTMVESVWGNGWFVGQNGTKRQMMNAADKPFGGYFEILGAIARHARLFGVHSYRVTTHERAGS